jgi:hypothetical protein
MEETPFYTPHGGVITTRQVMHENWPVLLVTHDADDGAWQFVNGWGDTDGSESGMVAWRESTTHDWKREPISD